ncbi:DUF2993 domain-containing protein [Synechococcus elongatus]|uniref:LmeA family phospholipid-binding protein n=1 Tax=Synechococcus elongatus TaxID=32046 RepID=UPI000F7DCB3F|nr:DUF2993 domain-containing protein [Synechococcus elongatus]
MGTAPGIIGRVLAPAIKLWLHSQATIAQLDLTIGGSSRQLLGGTIPEVAIAAQGIVYQGLCLERMSLLGSEIRVNLPQMVRGQAFQLLQEIRIAAEVQLLEANFNDSLSSELWQQAIWQILADYWQQLGLSVEQLATQLQFRLRPDRLHLLITPDTELSLGLALVDPQTLRLHSPQWQSATQPAPDLSGLEAYAIALGEDVSIASLVISDGKVDLTGEFRVLATAA